MNKKKESIGEEFENLLKFAMKNKDDWKNKIERIKGQSKYVRKSIIIPHSIVLKECENLGITEDMYVEIGLRVAYRKHEKISKRVGENIKEEARRIFHPTKEETKEDNKWLKEFDKSGININDLRKSLFTDHPVYKLFLEESERDTSIG